MPHRISTLFLFGAVVVAVTSNSAAGGAFAQNRSENTLRTYQLRVGSASAGGAVRVRGAVWVDGSVRQVQVVDQETPFELTVLADIVNGIFQADQDGAIQVELVDLATGQRRLQGTGRSIVVAQ